MLDILLSPTLLLSLVVALIYAALFHLWQGRSLRDLAGYIVAAVAGFAMGQIVGLQTNWSWLDIGQVNMVEASLASWIALFIAKRLKV